MKKLNSKLFEDNELVGKLEMESIYGGNKSDVNYSDSKRGGHWDIAVMSVIDTVDSSRSLDMPTKTKVSSLEETKLDYGI